VRNKYCCICHIAVKKSIIIEHLCFKNWNGPSTGMEADIIVDGFKQSLLMHGIVYSKLIGKTFFNKIKYLVCNTFYFVYYKVMATVLL